MARPPFSTDGFIGQKRMMTYLHDLFDAAEARAECGVPTLLAGRAGCGKTTVAKALAARYGVKCRTFVAGRDVTPAKLCAHLLELRDTDMLFIDEVHALPNESQELLYSVLDQSQMPKLGSDGKLDKSEVISVPPFSLICASTRPGSVLPPLRSRLDVVWFSVYSRDELKEIARAAGEANGITLTAQGARVLAERCQGSPRILHRYVLLLKRLAAPSQLEFTQRDTEELLRKKGISTHGLDEVQQQYLHILAAAPGGRSTLERLASQLGSADTLFIRQEVETFLVALRAITIEPRYRVLTEEGQQIVAELQAAQDEEEA